MAIAIPFVGTNFLGHGEPFADPRVNLRVPLGQLYFTISGAGGPPGNSISVYSNAALSSILTQPIVADAGGTFPPIYLNPFTFSGKYRVDLYSAAGAPLWFVDPVWIPQPLTTTSDELQMDSFGDITIPQPQGGSGFMALIVDVKVGGSALQLIGANTAVGGATEPAINFTNSTTTGAQTATFASNTLPSASTTGPTAWLPILANGVTYYTPLWPQSG
jgi:hypothetical protein